MPINKKYSTNLRKMALLVFVFAFIATLSFLLTARPQHTSATVAGFDAGNIMSDYVMGDYNSMSEASIQAFLKSKNHCNNREIHKANQYPTVHYNIRDGHFVCMADDLFNGETAAHIIWQAAQDYRINPKVLIVLLEKEQGLITDTWPNSRQYRTATGFGCPDTAACDSQYFGLKNQIRNSANLFRSVLNGGWTNYPVGWNYIQYSPNKDCGGSNIYIINRATSALYRYTPYQPNAGALASHPGTAYCGAYGNRNFYSFFTDWFGSTQIKPDPYKTITINSTYIPNGTYTFITETGKALDVSGGKGEVGDNIQIWNDNNTNAQKWNINREKDGFYTIKNIISGKVLDVEGGSHNFGANVHLWKQNNTCAQKWGIIKKGDYYTFKSACSGNALDVAGGTINNIGSNVQSWRDNNSNAQMWKLKALDSAPIPNGTYTFITETGKALDVSGGKGEVGDNIQIWNDNNTNAQKWNINREKDGFYTIKNIISGKVLDVEGGSHNFGANVHLWKQNNTCAQKWGIIKKGDYYTFKSACSGNALDVAGGTINNIGSNVQSWRDNNSNAQMWKLKK